jgi:hypothetical protein
MSVGVSSIEASQGGREKIINADIVVLAIGYQKLSIDYLPQDIFPE